VKHQQQQRWEEEGRTLLRQDRLAMVVAVKMMLSILGQLQKTRLNS
jgi:hypothetical protein